MPYNVALALQDGHSPEDIARYLGQQKGYNTDLALQDGHDAMDIIKHLNPPTPETTAFGAFKHRALEAALPTAAGAISGALTGAGTGAVAGTLGAGPIGTFVGSTVGAIGGGLYGGYKASQAQGEYLQSHPELAKSLGIDEETRKLEQEQHPIASNLGELAPNLALFRPSPTALRNLAKSTAGLGEKEATALAAEKAATVRNMAVNAGLQGGLDIGTQAAGEEPIDWTRVGLSAATGALGMKETALGRRLNNPLEGVKKRGEEYAKLAIKEAANNKTEDDVVATTTIKVGGKEQTKKTYKDGSVTIDGKEVVSPTNTMAGYTPEEPGVYTVKVNGKEGTLEVMPDGTQKFNGQVVSEPIKVDEATPISTEQEMPAVLKKAKPSILDEGVDYSSPESVNAHIRKLKEEQLKNAYQEPEEIMGTPDRPEATPIESTEPFPHLTDEEQQRIDQLKKEVDEKTKEFIDLGKKNSDIKPSKKTAPLVNSLFRALNDKDLREIDPRPFRPAKDKYDVQNINPFVSLRSKKGNTGRPLVDIIADGSLNGYLPPELQAPTSGEQELMMEAGKPYDPSDADTYIKNKIGNYDFLTYETSNHIKELGHNIDYLEEEINRHLTIEEQNAEIQRLFDEQREADEGLNEPTSEKQAGIAPASKGETPETFALEGYTPEQIRLLEAAKEARQAEETAKNKAQDEADRQAREQQEIKDRSKAASDEFRLGQSAEDNLSGQKDIFGDEASSAKAPGPDPRQMGFDFETPKTSAEHPEWATKHEPDVGGQVVYSDADSALMRGHSRLTGQNVYVGIDRATGSRTLTDIDSFNGKWMDQKIIDRLRNEKTKVVAADEAKQSKFPDGPFQGAKDNVVGSKTVDPRYVGMLSQLTKKMGLGDVKIFLLHPTDVRNNADEYHLHGDYASAMSAGSDIGEDGSVRVYGPDRKDFYISIKPGMSEGRTVETIAHELGHIVEKVAFKNAPEATQTAIKAEYEKWLMANKGGTAKELIHSLRNRESAEAHANSVLDNKPAEDLTNYWRSFSEWFADNTSRWATTAEKPVGVVEKFFADLGRKLREYVGMLTGKKYPPAKTVADFLDAMGPGATDEWFKSRKTTSTEAQKSLNPFAKEEPEARVPNQTGKDAINIMEGLNRRPPEPDKPYLQKVQDAIQNAKDNPSTTAAAIKKDAKSFVQHWSDKIQTWTFSADAALNNAIRRAIMDSTSLDMSEKIQAMMSVSMSQTVHADAVSSIFLEMGNIKYDSSLHKWVGEKSNDTFRALADKLNEVAKKNGLTVQQAEHMFHTATEARRLKDFIAENDGIDRKRTESKAQVQELLKQAADELGKTVDLFGIINIKDLNKSKSLREAIKLQDEISKMGSGKRLIHSLDPTIEGKPDLDAVKAQIEQAEQLFKKMPELEDAVKVWNGIRKNSIDKLVETGLWTKEEAQTMMDNINYVPFFREEQLENNAGPKEFLNGLQVQAKERRATGSYMPVNDIFDNMVRWTQYAINRSVRNKSSMSMVDLAGELGLAHKIPAPKRGLNVTRVWRDGKQEFWHMEDPMFVEAFHGLEGVSIPTFKAASAIANVLRKAIVLNPIFATSQVFQDSFAAIYTSGLSPKYALKIPARAVLEYVRTLRGTSKTHEELRPTGAVGVKDYSSTATRNDAKIFAGVQPPPGGWTKVKGMLEHVSMASDNAVRQAVYQATMEARAAKFEVEARSIADPQKRQAFLEDKKAEAKSEALEKAFEVINFRRRGSAKMMMIGGQLIPFFNAYLAAQNVALKTLSGIGISPTARAYAYKTLAATTGSVVTLSILYSMLNGNDEGYLKKQATVRDRLLVIPGSGGFSIPLRSDVFTMPKIIAEHTYLMMTNNATEDSRKFRDSVASSIVSSVSPPTLVPQVIKPAVEVALNYDFYQQKPLIGTFQKGLDVSRQFNDGTSEFARTLGQTGLIAPINADHLIRGMTGSVGGLFLMLTNPLIHHDPTVERPTLSWNDWMASVPGNSAFMSRDNQNGLKKDFYVLKEAVDKASATFNDIKKRTPSEAKEYLESPENKARVQMHTEIDRIGKNLTANRQRMAQISNMPESRMSSEQKEKQLKALQDREDMMLKNINIKKLRAQAQI